ncbi:MAG TPA: hypothetical protein VGF67_02725 [Ktedonobacteraceae bacterium]|jgi:nucleoside phosphorylase
MDKADQSCDVCIVCALPEEAEALLEIGRQEWNICFEERIGGTAGRQYDYRLGRMSNSAQESITLHVSWLPRYGPEEMTLHLSSVIEHFCPRMVVMTGICAGDPQKVRLGDLVVADRTYTYDSGKYWCDEQGRQFHLHNTLTYALHAQTRQFLGMFHNWKSLIARLQRSLIGPGQPEVQLHIEPLASGSAVHTDNPFRAVQVPVYKTLAIDMEGSAVGLVMSRYPLISWLIVKGVSDYADSQKSDAYHGFAASGSSGDWLAKKPQPQSRLSAADERVPAVCGAYHSRRKAWD